jgi:hypothetical protein
MCHRPGWRVDRADRLCAGAGYPAADTEGAGRRQVDVRLRRIPQGNDRLGERGVKKVNESVAARKKANPNDPAAAADTSSSASAASGAAGAAQPARGAGLAPSIKQSPLAGIFAKYPFDGTPKTYFPRVAVTVTDWSRSDCWTAVATLWKTKSKSESIPPFSVCWGTGLGFAVNNAANLHLFMQQSAAEHSGNVRSIGPKPPMLAVPNQTPMRESQQENFTGFIQQLVLDTGWQPGAPTNMWLVAFDPNGSKGVQSVPVASGSGADRSARAESSEESATLVGQSVSKQCKADNFSIEKYNRIVAGMSFDSVKKIIGCEPDPDFTRRNSDYVVHMWQATINNLVAARAIEVFFDASGTKVAPLGKNFKSAKGF